MHSIVVRHFGLLQPLSYWQAAGLWFLLIVLLAPVGIGSRHLHWSKRHL